MTKIKVKSIEFNPAYPFRKFKNLNIPLAERITLICGHNGVGKSTLLGLLSSLSGLRESGVKSYFGKDFDASIADIVYIDYASEVDAPKKAGTLAEPLVHYEIDGSLITKECSLTRRGNARRARVVARNKPHKKITVSNVSVGPDAKVPLPTIYLGMVRMLPIGESPDSRVQNTLAVPWQNDDIAFMFNFVKKIIPWSGATQGAITSNRVKSTKKLSTHPSYPYGPRSVSLGQDSLGAIVTALASFQKIKRDIGDDRYHGGVLIIDEIDAGFHPHALRVLVTELRKAADNLCLQIIATTHSACLIEAIHPEGITKVSKNKDGVVYLKNTRSPEYDPDLTLAEILQDMNLAPPAAVPGPMEIKIYFEDDEAKEVFEIITRADFIKEVEDEYGVDIRPMPLGVGCSSLALLPSKDSYFEGVVLVVDADGPRPRTLPNNLLELPGGKDKSGNLSPERTLIQYIRSLVEDSKSVHACAWSDSRMRRYSQDSLHANLLADLPEKIDRKAAKSWWNEKRDFIKRWGLYEYWAKENQSSIDAYEQQFKKVVKAAYKSKRASEEKIRRALAG